MPIYDYRCASCGHRFEVIHGVHATGPAACPACAGGTVTKAVVASAVHFKGSGWAKMERRPGGSGSSRAAGDGESGGPTKDAPTKDAPSDTSKSKTDASTPATKESASSTGGTAGSD